MSLDTAEVRDEVAEELMDLVRVVQATGKKRSAARPRPLSISKMPSGHTLESPSSSSQGTSSSPLAKERKSDDAVQSESKEKIRSPPRKNMQGTPPPPPESGGASSDAGDPPVPPARTSTPVHNKKKPGIPPPKLFINDTDTSSGTKIVTEGNRIGPSPQPGQESSRTAKGPGVIATADAKFDPGNSLSTSEDMQGRARGPSVSKVNKPTKSAMIVDVLKAGKNSYVYVLEVERVGDTARAKIYNTFEDFFDLHLQLLGHFPVEAGAAASSNVVRSPNDKRIIPDLPSQMMFVTYEVARTRGVALQTYIDAILTLPAKISRSPVVNAFFNPRNSFGKHATQFTSVIEQAVVET